MAISSEYTFPIFISSTDYNLKDFRAELARFLAELGYRPILSSSEGFPDRYPKLEPWESCLPVLDNVFVTILVIDGTYGADLSWPNYKDCFGDNKISPTHAEYVYAHKIGRRMLVFIRKNLMSYYQSYRKCMKKTNDDVDKARLMLEPTLPKYVDFKVLQFINEVKTIKPISWIMEFEDVTSVKTEIQKKMLNELAEVFQMKDLYTQTVIDSFNKVMNSLSPEKQKEILRSLSATKELITNVDQLELYKSELEETKSHLNNSEKLKEDQKKLFEKKEKTLEKQIQQLEAKTKESASPFYLNNGNINIGNPNFEFGALTPSGNSLYGLDNLSPAGNLFSAFANPLEFSSAASVIKLCDKCHQPETGVITIPLKNCPSCNRDLCRDCWPNSFFAGPVKENICPDCKEKIKGKN